MGKVRAGATVSLDGYVAGPDETGFEHLLAGVLTGLPVTGRRTSKH